MRKLLNPKLTLNQKMNACEWLEILVQQMDS